MQRQDLIALLTPEAMRLLDSLPELDAEADVLRLVASLRADGHDPRLVAAVLTQAKLRRKARAKFGEFADAMLFTDAGLQQATRLSVAAHHADRFRRAGVRRIADLGCGIGADSMAFASLGFDLVAVDADEITAAVATHNLAMFANAEVRHGRAEDQDLSAFDGLWFDPARRETAGGTTTRLYDPSDWTPALDFVFGTAATHAIGVKLGPGFDRDLIPEDAEAQWVSVDGHVVELAVWMGGTQRPDIRRAALILGRDGAHELTAPADSPDAETGPLGAYLYEPDGAVIRSRLIGQLAASMGARMIAPDIAWMTADEEVRTPFAAGFRVREVLPLHAATLKKELRARGIGVLEIKKRGVDVDPAVFRTKLALKGPESATLILTRVGDRRVAILADRVPDAAA